MATKLINIANGSGTILPVDSTITDGSTNPVSGNAVYDAVNNSGAVFTNPDWLASDTSSYVAPIFGGRSSVSKPVGARTLGDFRQKSATANISSSNTYLTDVTSTDSVYGTTALQLAPLAQTYLTLSPVAANAVGTNVNNGIIRWWFKPIANLQDGSTAINWDRINIELYSTGDPTTTTPSANYHALDAIAFCSVIRQFITASTGTGRWQCFSIPSNRFTAVGTGADLTAITFARLVMRTKTGVSMVLQTGVIDWIPNRFTKAKCIFSFDDGWQSHLTYAANAMAKYGFKGVLFPSPITDKIGVDTQRLTVQQIKNMNDILGWQIGSQAWSTEQSPPLDVTENSFTAELGRLRAWQRSIGVTGGEHGSYFSSIGPNQLQAYQTFRKHFRSMRTFYNGFASGDPFGYGETLPVGDPMGIRCLNMASSFSNIYTSLKAHVDQAITNKGLAYFGIHDELATPGTLRTAFDSLLVYLDANRDVIDVITEEDLYNL